MVHDAPIVRPELHSADEDILGEVRWQDKAPKLVGTIGRHSILYRQGQDDVGLSCLPALGKYRRGGLLRRITFRRSRLGPFFDERDLRVRKPALVGEPIAWLRLPWRHVPPLGDRGNELCTLRRVRIRE